MISCGIGIGDIGLLSGAGFGLQTTIQNSKARERAKWPASVPCTIVEIDLCVGKAQTARLGLRFLRSRELRKSLTILMPNKHPRTCGIIQTPWGNIGRV